MSTAANRQRQPLAAREIDRADHICHTRTACDERRAAVVGPVPDAAFVVVVRVPWPDDRAAQPGGELGDGGLADAGRPSLRRCHDAFLLIAVGLSDPFVRSTNHAREPYST